MEDGGGEAGDQGMDSGTSGGGSGGFGGGSLASKVVSSSIPQQQPKPKTKVPLGMDPKDYEAYLAATSANTKHGMRHIAFRPVCTVRCPREQLLTDRCWVVERSEHAATTGSRGNRSTCALCANL